MPKRQYTRRSDEERIAELQAKLEQVKTRVAERQRRDSPIQREVKKVQRALRKFAQFAVENERTDLANSTTAFLAGLERASSSPAHESAPRSRTAREA